MRADRSFVLALVLALTAACSTWSCGVGVEGDRASARPSAAGADAAPGTQEVPSVTQDAPAAVDSRARVVFLGDSLTAGLGLEPAQAYPTLIQHKIDAAGLPFQVVNAGVSGDTSAGGLSRLDWALDGDVRILVVALGGNDGLRGLPPAELEKNLSAIIERAQARQIAVILAGMEAPPNFGRDYIEAFHQVYPTLAAKYHVPLIPFLLNDVAGVERLNQRDGIHPTAEGARIVADTVWSTLRGVLQPT
jgi:acyl-CoA thioesterase-1